MISAIFLFREIRWPLFIVISTYFAITIFYGLMLQRRFDETRFSYIQIFLDVVIVSFLIFTTSPESGPVNNTFVVLYIIPIIAASLFFRLKVSVIVALFSSSLYIMIVLGYYLALPPVFRGSPLKLVYILYLRTIIFCLVGFLCGYLSTLLQKKGEEFSKLKNLHNMILHNMNSGLITTDFDNSIIYCNRAAENILGYSADDMIRQNLDRFFVYSDKEDFLLSETDPHNPDREKSEMIAKTNSGEEITIGFNLSFIRDDVDETVGKVLVFTDLTEVKQLEWQVRQGHKLKTMGEMAASVAHEIRNPLASIRGSIEMLAENMNCTEEQDRLLKVLLKESDRLNNIIEHFLAFARESSLNIEKQNISEIISEVVTLCNNDRSKNSNIRIAFHSPAHVEYVLGDEAQLKQVFFNLIRNAVDSIRDEGNVEIAINRDPADEQSLQIAINDTGEGIVESDLQRIFEPFYTTKSKGFGIGLPLAEKIIRNHNGTIDVESRPAGGSTFTVKLPTA